MKTPAWQYTKNVGRYKRKCMKQLSLYMKRHDLFRSTLHIYPDGFACTSPVGWGDRMKVLLIQQMCGYSKERSTARTNNNKHSQKWLYERRWAEWKRSPNWRDQQPISRRKFPITFTGRIKKSRGQQRTKPPNFWRPQTSRPSKIERQTVWNKSADWTWLGVMGFWLW